MKSITLIYRWFIALTVMLISGLLCGFIVIISFGKLRNFTAQHITKYTSRFILRVMGFQYVLPDLSKFPKDKVLLTFNHNSYLDIFLLTAIGLKNNRFILSTTTLKYIPLIFSAKALGTFYIPTKKHVERRLHFFKRMTERLNKNNYSITASSEGVHDYVHGIAPFNRGIYHMTLEAHLDVVPIFMFIPEECNLLKGDKHAVGGTLHLEVLERIKTSSWQFEKLDEHIGLVRQKFVNRFNELNPDHKTE